MVAEIIQCKNKLHDVQPGLVTDPTNEDLARDEISLQGINFKLMDQEESKAQQTGMINWLTQGDRNTKFFHAIVN